ncbi:basement membrane-specific heparan sulfate proteoglycan core protein isoform X12 [Prionailurus bengalensis]|uniref:basement membrane-specific heparan sulfate proteoglycan core protein isoform X12 n=1 Tax=Prionailurus bengalensis TaxID=37029 RepID=UPI001CA982D8|nr:basement membrane-specific heparan sulfate proteoglycan core protein isoform X12 [Prionailurus bengalensis]
MGQRAAGALLLALLLHGRLLAVTHGLRAYDGLSLPEDAETVTVGRAGRSYSDISDDEDLLADDASGDGLGSGEPGSGDFQMVYFRALVNFTRSIRYSPQLEDAGSEEFREVSEAVVDTLESEYLKIPGDQVVSVVFIKELDGWVFVELDVGSEGNADGAQIQEVLHTVISSGSVASYITSPQGFQFRRLGTAQTPPPPPAAVAAAVTPVPQFSRVCTEAEFACHSHNECVALEYRCDRRPDCRDMSDELNCEEEVPAVSSVSPTLVETPPAVPWLEATTIQQLPGTPAPQPLLPGVARPVPCGPHEAMCHDGQCIPKDYICDGQEDCKNGSDELNCGPPPPCEPNEFACGNGHCALKLWHCDGDFDCEDRTDEANCPAKRPEDVCGPTQFRCVSTNTCIPASFHCDEESDCPDRSDEFGCMPPQVVTPPQESIQASRGQTVTFTCVAIGVPTPIINWRLNWGHIPSHPRVTVTSEGGRGTLTIRDVKEADQGAYTCEAMNARGMVFGIPDGVLELIPKRGPCPDGHFSLEPSASCLPCFCFGVTSICQSSRRFRDQIRLRFDQPDDFKGVNVTMPAQPGMPPLSSTQLQIDPAVQEFQLVDLSRRFLVHDSFWALPEQFLGNKVDSYGGSLRYKVRYELARGMLEPVQRPDVVLVGAGYRLLSRGHVPTQPGTLNQRQVQFSEEHWVHESGRPVQRAEMLQVLQSLEAVLIQTVYNAKMASVGLSDIAMDTTVSHATSHGRAHSVEECRCPIGYSGLSCESCDAHFTRVPGGPYLGTCSGCNCNGHASSCDPVYGHCLNCQHNTEGPQCDKCKAGFFGDATKATATACRPCPCPYIDASRRFSDTCFLDTDGQATCDACAPGYTGRRCESCAPGYEGNPIQPGGKCRPTNQEMVRCDERGSMGSSGEACRCKLPALCLQNNVVGRLCNECVAGSFHLSARNPDGCLKCFCMGVSRQCTSSSWSRAQVRGASEEPTQFSLTNAAGTHTTSEGISSPTSGELVFSSFHNLLSGPYFWSLPSRFRGDKVTSYGGELRFTVTQRPQPGSTPLHGQPMVVLQGNGIVLEHHTSQQPSPGQPSTFTVPFREQAWQRPDGQPATREHLLMALAGIDTLLIQASFSQRPAESRVSGISMDVAVPEGTGQDPALEVEQCTCPPGYRGPSCQDCDTGYTRMPSGLYLGTCERCSCHGHSEICEPETGACQGCQHHTEGPQCERCQPGYYGDAQRGTPQDCQPCPCYGAPAGGQATHTCFLDTDGHPTCDACSPGHSGRHCERCAPGYYGNPSQGQPCQRDGQLPEPIGCGCDPKGSIGSQCDAAGQCYCKAQVEGLTCSHCRPHHFYLSASNPDGCVPCFCMGVTQQCASSSYSRHLISTRFAPGDFQGFALVNPQRNSRLTGGFTVEPVPEGAQLSFGTFAQLGHESFFWQLPEAYQGDKVAAYGGKLRYTLSYTAGAHGSPLSDPDVQITGNNIMLVASQPAPQGPERKSFEIIFREEFWRRPDGQPATREHLLMALADLDELLVRATFSSMPRAASISSVSLEVAQPGPSEGPRAMEVEECRCPPGYVGLSCQDCAPGYTRTGSGLYLGHCELCECNGHSDLCHPETGACSHCQHNAAGEFCELCAPGYYGDATAGTPEDCQPCACPLTNPENMFSRTCESLGAGGYRCTACEPGYTGQYCEQCAPGYVGNPNVRGGRCLPQADAAPLVVQVHPARTIVPQGGSHSLWCQVSGSPPHYFYWSREDGRPLPSSTQQRHQGSELHFPSVQPSDAGVYICTCRNLHRANTSRAELLVTEAPSKPITVTVEEQRSQSVRPGADVTFICTAKSKSPAYTLVWTRLHNGKLPARAMDFNGILTIRNVQPSDAGTYVCTGSNMFAMDQGTATLHVQASGTPSAPVVSIHPPQLTVQPGQLAEFRCSATGNPAPTLEWTGGPGGQLPQKAQIHGGILRLPAVEPSDQAQYLCRALNSAGQHVARAVLHVHGGSGPRVQVSPERTQVHEGRTVRLYCRAAGVPSATITWRKEGGSLPPQARSERTDIATLLIPAITAADAGFYLCVASSPAGTAQARIQVVVLPGASSPPVRIESSSPSVTEGQTLDLNCVVAGLAHTSITWYKRGGSLPPHSQVHGSRLRLPQVSPADSGEYVCRVENESGPKEASIVVSVFHNTHPGPGYTPAPGGAPAPGSTQLIRIESSSSHVAEGQTLDLNCVVPGQAHAQVTWHRRGGSLPTRHQVHGSRLRLPQVTPADSGEYICRVVSSSGTQEASVLVTIQQRLGPSHPQGVVYPVRIESSSASLANGHVLDLNCLVASQAPHTITWYKRGGSLPSRHQIVGSRLRIPQVTPADSGEYVCHVSNGAGSQETSLIVTIEGSGSSHVPSVSPPIKIESSSPTVVEGQTLDLNCVVAGQPQATITWYKRGGSLPAQHQAHGSRLRLHRMSVADSGEYVCRANNNIDAQEASIVVSVSPSTGSPSVPGGTMPVRIESSSSHVAEGQTVDLNCVVPGQAHAQVTWHKRGGSLPTHHQAHGSRLRLYQVSPADSGEYVCQVVSSSGPLEASVLVNIEASGSSAVPVPAPGGAPPIRIETSSSHVAEGQTLDLNCIVPGQAHAQVTWHRRGGSLPARHQVHGPLLRLNQVSPADSGEYYCQVTSSSGTLEASVLVTIEASSPSPIPAPGLAQPIYIEASSSHVAEGQTLDLNCVVPGQAHAQVTWYKRGGSLPARHQTHGSRLRLHHVSPADSGEYVCRVVGGSGPEQEASFTVTVPPSAGSSYRLRSPVISIDPPSSTVQQGQDASFKCLIHDGAAPISLEWKTRNQELEDNVHISPNGSIITIVGTRPSNHGAYRCVASNAYGVAQSVVNLSVHGPPTVSVLPEGPVRVKVGKSITLECVSAGEPRSSAHWTRIGAPTNLEQRMYGVVDSHTVLQISSAKPSDAGTYVCLARNALGTAQKRVEVIVDTGTVAPGAPQVQVEEAELTVEAGHTATLRCSATGSPTPTIHWSKLRSPLPWQHRLEGDTLIIPRVAQQDSGQYICNATSPTGHAEATIALHVESPPYATTVPEHASVRAGEMVQIQCLAHGTPPLTFQWSRVGGSLPGRATARNEMLRFEPAAPEDSGHYRCRVTNKVGSAEAFAQVLVQGPSGSVPATAIPAGSAPTVQVTPQLETKSVGASVEFHCAVPSDQGTQLRWVKEGGQLPPGHSVQDGVLRIQNLDQSCQGTYVCQAYGPWGQAQASAQLVVQALPSVLINIRTSVQTVVVGHAVEFECLALGDPKPQVTWSKVGGRLRPGIVQSGGIVRIAHVELADAGQYRCTATNAAGTTQSHVLLLVQALPQISTPPEVRVPAGSAAAFPCMVSGYPTPKITWSKLDGNLPPDSRVENTMLLLPSVRPQDAGTYVCTATNHQGKVKAFAHLQVPERVVPYFTQTPHSFLPLPTIKDAYRKFEIKITFRPDSADGLLLYSGMLLYNGQKRIPGSPTNLANRQPDFISFGLVGGRPEFRFDAGSGMATIRHPTPLALGQFHTVTLLRSLTQGSLIVGGLAPVNGTSQGKFQGLDLNEELYLGGYPDYGAIPKAGLSGGFVGCVRELRIQGEEIIFHDLNLTAHGISHCPTCRDRPCQNGGQCQDSESSSYVCICPAGFTGSRCEHSQALHCHPEACGPDATCVNRPDGRGYTCRCHLGRSGMRCEEGVTVTTPSMSGTGSYLALPALTNTHHELRLDIEFKPLAPDGILLFSGGTSGPVEDFVSLAMVGGHLEFRYELGSGLAVLRTPEPLALGHWHRVSAERLNKDGSLRVNSRRPVLRSSPGKSQGLNLHTLLYLGGVEPSVRLPPATNVSAHFRGCVGEVSVNGKRLDLTYSFLGSRGIGQCYTSSPCERQPCQNRATCMPTGEYEFQCLCPDGFKGDLCEHEENPCRLREPCLHGGVCQGTRCLCPPGFSGPRCQQGSGQGTAESDWHLEGSGGNDAPGQYGAYFHDDGFLALPGHVFSRSLPEVPETIELEVRTSMANGLLLWQGVDVGEAGRGKDFISLGLQDGHLVFSYQLGSGEARLVSEDPINDGEWHRVTALREGRRGSIQVDGEELVSGQSPGPNVAVNTKGSIYIGGAPDVSTLTGGRFSTGITGCIKNLVLHSARPGAPPPQPLDLEHRAQAGASTRPCPS